MRTRSIVSALVVATIWVVSSACGNKVTSCVDSDCAPGNKCIASEGDIRCRKTCSSNTDSKTSCPFGYVCADPASGGTPYCVAIEATVNGQPLKAGPGQWGAPCVATKGMNNSDCDQAQGFLCYAESPTDADAYCTRFDCTKDLECGPGFGCGKINRTPNADTAKRAGVGDVQRVCQRRSYCSSCTTDADCPTIAGTSQHCIHDSALPPFCTSECVGAGTCPNEAKCIVANIGATMVCYPRSKQCTGDGSICSPCQADTDCGPDGACIKGDYTTEKSCAKSRSACAQCPTTIANPARQVGCLKTATNTQPANFCFGLYAIDGEPSDIGCYSPDR